MAGISVQLLSSRLVRPVIIPPAKLHRQDPAATQTKSREFQVDESRMDEFVGQITNKVEPSVLEE